MSLFPVAARPAWACVLLVLGGCATSPSSQRTWRVEPVQAVTHGAATAQDHYRIGRQVEHTRDWARAAEFYRLALRRDPAHLAARNSLAVVLARLGLHEEAEAQWRQALADAPQRADLHSNLGYLLLMTGRPREALAALDTALGLDPHDAVARANHGLAQQAQRAVSGIPLVGQTAAAAAPARPAAPAAAAAAAASSGPGAPLQVASRATLPALRLETPPHALARPAGAAPPVADTFRDLPTAQGAADIQATLEISNGMGRAGAGLLLRGVLQQQGLSVQRVSNLPPFRQPHTVVRYRPGHQAAARRVSRALPLSVPLVQDASQQADVRVLIGQDWPAAVSVAAAPGG